MASSQNPHRFFISLLSSVLFCILKFPECICLHNADSVIDKRLVLRSKLEQRYLNHNTLPLRAKLNPFNTWSRSLMKHF